MQLKLLDCDNCKNDLENKLKIVPAIRTSTFNEFNISQELSGDI